MATNSPVADLQPFLQRAGFETLRDCRDGCRQIGSAQRADSARRSRDATALRFVGRVVEHLDFEQLARVIELRDGFDQPLDHVALVVNRELHGNLRPVVNFGRRARGRFCGA